MLPYYDVMIRTKCSYHWGGPGKKGVKRSCSRLAEFFYIVPGYPTDWSDSPRTLVHNLCHKHKWCINHDWKQISREEVEVLEIMES
jgi:hypothetical protein